MTGIAGSRWLREVTAPALLQPIENLKVSVGEDDGQCVVRAPALQIPGDIDATFSVEEAGGVGNFMIRHCRRTVIGNEKK